MGGRDFRSGIQQKTAQPVFVQRLPCSNPNQRRLVHLTVCQGMHEFPPQPGEELLGLDKGAVGQHVALDWRIQLFDRHPRHCL